MQDVWLDLEFAKFVFRCYTMSRMLDDVPDVLYAKFSFFSANSHDIGAPPKLS